MNLSKQGKQEYAYAHLSHARVKNQCTIYLSHMDGDLMYK